MLEPILLCYGTRPEWIKLKPLIEEFRESKIEYKILFTGQQKDIADVEGVDYLHTMSNMSTNRLDSIVKNCLSIPEKYFYDVGSVLVQGDTGTAFGIALTAYHRQIPVIHLEAGLRTYDLHNPFPEEGYRQMIARIATIHLCPTSTNVHNLIKEHSTGLIEKVGNTSIDALVPLDLKTSTTGTVLITLHRRENHAIMHKWFLELNNLAKKYPTLSFILPLHPNPEVTKHKNILTDVQVVPPLSHSELLELIVKSSIIITDSGGIQEEASYYNKKTIVCRTATERVESLNKNAVLCKTPIRLHTTFKNLLTAKIPAYECPYGDGTAAKQITVIIKNYGNIQNTWRR